MACRLCQELPAYLARAEGVSFNADRINDTDLAAKKVKSGGNNEDNLPHWAGAVKMVLLIQPSSAAPE